MRFHFELHITQNILNAAKVQAIVFCLNPAIFPGAACGRDTLPQSHLKEFRMTPCSRGLRQAIPRSFSMGAERPGSASTAGGNFPPASIQLLTAPFASGPRGPLQGESQSRCILVIQARIVWCLIHDVPPRHPHRAVFILARL